MGRIPGWLLMALALGASTGADIAAPLPRLARGKQEEPRDPAADEAAKAAAEAKRARKAAKRARKVSRG